MLQATSSPKNGGTAKYPSQIEPIISTTSQPTPQLVQPPPATQSTESNLFGRIKKACSVKTKFATSSLKHSLNQNSNSTFVNVPNSSYVGLVPKKRQTDPLVEASCPKELTKSNSKTIRTSGKSFKSVNQHEPRVPIGVPLTIQTSAQPSSNGTFVSGPVITGAVTKSPATGTNCSPSKQLLNSIFSTTSSNNTKSTKQLSSPSVQTRSKSCNKDNQHEKHSKQRPQMLLVQLQSPKEVSHLLNVTSEPHTPIDDSTEENSTKLRQSISHDSLLNVKHCKKKDTTSVISDMNPIMSTTSNNLHNGSLNSGQKDSTSSGVTINPLNENQLTGEGTDMVELTCSPTNTDHHRQQASNSCNNLPTLLATTPTTNTGSQLSTSTTLLANSIVESGTCSHGQVCIDSRIVGCDDLHDPNSKILDKTSKCLCSTTSNSLDNTATTSTLKKLYNNILGSSPQGGTISSNKSAFVLESNNVILNNHPSYQTQRKHSQHSYNSFPSYDASHLPPIYMNHNTLNLNNNLNNDIANAFNSKLYHKTFTLSHKMRRSISKDSIDEKHYWIDQHQMAAPIAADKQQQFDDYLKTNALLNNFNNMVSCFKIKTLFLPTYYGVREKKSFQ